MTWVKLDDRWDEHPKMLRVGDLGRLMWVCGLTYSARNLSDGFIPFEAVARLTSLRAWKPLASKLVQAGLWEPADGGYAIHDYKDYQPLRAEVDASRESHVRRTKEWRCRSRDASRDASHPHLGDGAVTVPRPDPVPIPSQTGRAVGDPDGEPVRRRTSPKRPLPDAWVPTERDVAYATRKGWDELKVAAGAEHFTAHHRKERTLSADWHSSWVTWVINDAKFNRQSTTLRVVGKDGTPEHLQRTLDKIANLEKAQ